MENTSLSTVEYSSDYRYGASYKEVFQYYIYAIKRYRQFIWVNFLKHFKASYQKSFMRKLWMIIIPLVPVSVYIVLQQLGLLRGTSEMPKVIYVVVGMTFWQLFASSLVQTMGAAQKEKAMLKKINLPFIIFTISSLGVVLFDYLVRIFLIWILLLYFKVSFSFSWFALPFMLIPFVFMGFTLGIFLSFFSVYFNDVNNIVNIFIRYGLFASGVIFPIPQQSGIGELLSYNPIFIFIETMRNLLVFGKTDDSFNFFVTLFLIMVFLIFNLKKLYVLEPNMREFL